MGTEKIHVHHKTYKRFTNERVDLDLIPLCKDCHKNLHIFCKRNKLSYWHGTEKFVGKEVWKHILLSIKEYRVEEKIRQNCG